MSDRRKMLFRTDANRVIGAGHLMRCLALAKTARNYGIESMFCLADTETTWTTILEDEKLAYTSVDLSNDPKSTGKIAAEFGSGWIAVDGYRFDAQYYNRLREFTESSILAFDDGLELRSLPVDAVLNGNPYAERDSYADYDQRVDRLVGAAFAPLDPRFSELRDQRRETQDLIYNVLVTFGGSNADDQIRDAIHALASLETSIRVTLIGLLPDGVQVSGLEVQELPFSNRIADLMAEMDFAICGGGSTTLQLACLGVPCLVIPIAENQRLLVQTLLGAGVVVSVHKGADLSEALQQLLNPSCRKAISIAGRNLIDGRGANRVIEHLFGLN